ncbi:unnamed protein product, partial [Menidia menidia]
RSDQRPTPNRANPSRAKPSQAVPEQIQSGTEKDDRDMTLRTVRQLFLLCLLAFFGSWSVTDARPFDQWEEGIVFPKVRDVQSEDVRDVLWGDQNQFLFHYSKARNSIGAVQQQSHSVHPLLRLSPKLSQRRKKKVLLLKIRGLPEGML